MPRLKDIKDCEDLMRCRALRLATANVLRDALEELNGAMFEESPESGEIFKSKNAEDFIERIERRAECWEKDLTEMRRILKQASLSRDYVTILELFAVACERCHNLELDQMPRHYSETEKLQACWAAVNHILERMRLGNQALIDSCGAATQSFELLTEAAHRVSGHPVNFIRNDVIPCSTKLHRRK